MSVCEGEESASKEKDKLLIIKLRNGTKKDETTTVGGTFNDPGTEFLSLLCLPDVSNKEAQCSRSSKLHW